MTAPDRPSAAFERQDQGRWRSVIRVFAILVAMLGLVLIGNEILENIATCNSGACARIHLATMLWGVALLAFGMLVLQKGDVTMSLQDVIASGSIVRGWFTRSGRSTDAPGTTVDTVVSSPVRSIEEPPPETGIKP